MRLRLPGRGAGARAKLSCQPALARSCAPTRLAATACCITAAHANMPGMRPTPCCCLTATIGKAAQAPASLCATAEAAALCDTGTSSSSAAGAAGALPALCLLCADQQSMRCIFMRAGRRVHAQPRAAWGTCCPEACAGQQQCSQQAM